MTTVTPAGRTNRVCLVFLMCSVEFYSLTFIGAKYPSPLVLVLSSNEFSFHSEQGDGVSSGLLERHLEGDKCHGRGSSP